MSLETLPWLTAGIFVIALLYSSVGHAGASGYIAVMALFGMAPEEIRPIALALNILVAMVGTWHFYSGGYFRWNLFWPFAALSTPLAFLGGGLNLPAPVLKAFIGGVLLFSAARFLFDPREAESTRAPSRTIALITGGILGLLAGLTGTGGGIFLTPLMIVMRWASTKTAAATSVVFILVNSIAGLLGTVSSPQSIPDMAQTLAATALALAPAALVGGTTGSYLGSKRFSPPIVKRLLAAVLIIAGLKLIGVEWPGDAMT